MLEDLNNKQGEEEESVTPSVKVKIKTKGSNFDDADMLQKVQAWSKDDQKRLETALQMYPKSTLGDRWGKISSHVGKSKVFSFYVIWIYIYWLLVVNNVMCGIVGWMYTEI